MERREKRKRWKKGGVKKMGRMMEERNRRWVGEKERKGETGRMK